MGPRSGRPEWSGGFTRTIRTTMQLLLSYLQVGITFLLVITALVAVHEWGHYFVARRFGMKVNAFAVMMGGIRERGFAQRMGVELEPAWMPWVMGLVASTILYAGRIASHEYLVSFGLFLLALPLPIWVVHRLARLYKRPQRNRWSTLINGYAVAGLLSFFGLKSPPALQDVLGLIVFGGWLGVLLTYYSPVLSRGEEEEQGYGTILTDQGETVSVRFRPLWHRVDKNGTEFSVLLLPLGGFAAIHGMAAREDGSEVKIEGGFYSKPAWQRFLVLFAGPLASITFGILLLGAMVKSSGLGSGKFQIESFQELSMGRKVGLREGDVMVSVNGTRVTPEVVVSELVEKGPDDAARIVVNRNGEELSFHIPLYTDPNPRPRWNEDGLATGETYNPKIMGIKFSAVLRPCSWGEALSVATTIPFEIASNLVKLAKSPSLLTHNVGGAASMVAATKSATDDGLASVLRMAGLLSISMGVMNLLPIHPLDGGQMVVAFIEMFRKGKRLSYKSLGMISAVGLMFVALLTLTVLIADVSRFTGRGG